MTDPIIEELYQAREKILEECDGDLDKLFERYRSAEESHPDRLVTAEDLGIHRGDPGRLAS
jgi:hypothetical protein